MIDRESAAGIVPLLAVLGVLFVLGYVLIQSGGLAQKDFQSEQQIFDNFTQNQTLMVEDMITQVGAPTFTIFQLLAVCAVFIVAFAFLVRRLP
jgi:di/tricarboxylate transporter